MVLFVKFFENVSRDIFFHFTQSYIYLKGYCEIDRRNR